IVEPAAHPGKFEIRFPAKRHITDQDLLRQLRRARQTAVIEEEVIGQSIQVPLAIGEPILRDGVSNAVAAVLVEIAPLREVRDRLPILGFEGAACGALKRYGSGRLEDLLACLSGRDAPIRL